MTSCSSNANGQSETQAQISLGDQPNQTKSFTFPKRTFTVKKLIYRSFQPSWFKKWPCLHYNQVNDEVFCFTCLKVSMMGILLSGAYSRSDAAFVNHGYTNWKNTCKDKKGGFPFHELSHFHRHCTGMLT